MGCGSFVGSSVSLENSIKCRATLILTLLRSSSPAMDPRNISFQACKVQIQAHLLRGIMHCFGFGHITGFENLQFDACFHTNMRKKVCRQAVIGHIIYQMLLIIGSKLCPKVVSCDRGSNQTTVLPDRIST